MATWHHANRKEELDEDKASSCIQLQNEYKKEMRYMETMKSKNQLPMGASVSEALYSDVTMCLS
jgi:hypothetical protein